MHRDRQIQLHTMRGLMKTKLLRTIWVAVLFVVSLVNATFFMAAVPQEPAVAVISGLCSLLVLTRLGQWWEALLGTPRDTA